MTAAAPFELDRKLLRRRLARAAGTHGEVEPLAHEIARRMDERLDYIRIEPRRILDLGCGTGRGLASLGKRFPAAMRVGIDWIAPPIMQARDSRGVFDRLLRRGPPPAVLACADALALPLATGSISMAWSNLMLQWLTDPLPAFVELHRVLEVGGMVMFSTLGPDTLKEVRAALPDTHGERVHRFIDMHDLGDALVRAGFSDPVMDMEVMTMTYSGAEDLFADLRRAGANNASLARPRGLSGKAGWEQARQALEAMRVDGRLPITFEIIQGHAWKTAPKTIADGRSVIRFEKRT